MPMNAPVMEMTGTDFVPTSYICGKTSRMFFQRSHPRPIQRKVRRVKVQNSPNSARKFLVLWPSLSIIPIAMVRHHRG